MRLLTHYESIKCLNTKERFQLYFYEIIFRHFFCHVHEITGEIKYKKLELSHENENYE